MALAFAIFMHAHIVSDFSVLNVFENSNTEKPMLYKVTGAWGSHEGSMMLWVFMLALFGAAGRGFRPHPAGDACAPARWRSRACSALGILAFILGTSNPFAAARSRSRPTGAT